MDIQALGTPNERSHSVKGGMKTDTSCRRLTTGPLDYHQHRLKTVLVRQDTMIA
jgi:hypothetical protein